MTRIKEELRHREGHPLQGHVAKPPVWWLIISGLYTTKETLLELNFKCYFCNVNPFSHVNSSVLQFSLFLHDLRGCQ